MDRANFRRDSSREASAFISSGYLSYDPFAVVTNFRNCGKSTTEFAWDKNRFDRSTFSCTCRASLDSTGMLTLIASFLAASLIYASLRDSMLGSLGPDRAVKYRI